MPDIVRIDRLQLFRDSVFLDGALPRQVRGLSPLVYSANERDVDSVLTNK